MAYPLPGDTQFGYELCKPGRIFPIESVAVHNDAASTLRQALEGFPQSVQLCPLRHLVWHGRRAFVRGRFDQGVLALLVKPIGRSKHTMRGTILIVARASATGTSTRWPLSLSSFSTISLMVVPDPEKPVNQRVNRARSPS